MPDATIREEIDGQISDFESRGFNFVSSSDNANRLIEMLGGTLRISSGDRLDAGLYYIQLLAHRYAIQRERNTNA